MFEATRLDANSDSRTGDDLTELVTWCQQEGWQDFAVSETNHHERIYSSDNGYGLLLPDDYLPNAIHRRWTGHWFYFPPSSETKAYYEAAEVKPLTIADLPWALGCQHSLLTTALNL